MRYMLMVCGDESDHEKSPEEMRNDHEGFAWFEEMDRRGVLRGGNRLRPGSDATTVRVRDDEVLLSGCCSPTVPSPSPGNRWAATT